MMKILQQKKRIHIIKMKKNLVSNYLILKDNYDIILI